MRTEIPKPISRRSHELARTDAPVLVAENSAQQTPAFRVDLRRSLRMHPVLAGSAGAAVFVLLLGWALSRKPVYTAESLIYVEPQEVRVLNDGSGSGYDASRYDSYLQQQIQTVERADTLEAAIAKLPPGVWRFPGESTPAAVNRLRGSLKVERVLNSYQLALDVTAGDAKGAAAAANAVTSAYLEEGRKDEHSRADQRLQLLLDEQQRITGDMARDKAEQVSLGKSLGVASPSANSGGTYDLQEQSLQTQLESARVARDTAEAQLASVSGANGAGLDTAANELITADPGLVSIRQTLSQRRAQISDQMAGLTPGNPVYRQDQEELGVIDRAIDRATSDARQRAKRQLQDKLRLDLQRTADVEGRLNAQLAQQTAKATGAGPKLQRAAELETDLQRLRTRYASVDDAIRGLQLETNGPGQAHLSLAAQAPDSAEPSRSRLVLLMALPLAMLCGIAAAVIARKRDPKLYLPDDLQELLGFAPMAALPNPSEVSAAASGEFLLRLAGALEGAYRHGGARSFVFTPVSVEGFQAGLLSQICVRLQQLGFEAGYVDAEELMPGVESSTSRLEIARSGQGLSTGRLERLLQVYDLLLIQAPPLLGSALTEYAVRRADATILMVRSGQTDRTALRQAAALLERLNPQGIGTVLEGMPMRYADASYRAAVRAAGFSSRAKHEDAAQAADPGDAEPSPEAEPVPEAMEPDTAFEEPEVSAAPTFEEIVVADENQEKPAASPIAFPREEPVAMVQEVREIHEVHEPKAEAEEEIVLADKTPEKPAVTAVASSREEPAATVHEVQEIHEVHEPEAEDKVESEPKAEYAEPDEAGGPVITAPDSKRLLFTEESASVESAATNDAPKPAHAVSLRSIISFTEEAGPRGEQASLAPKETEAPPQTPEEEVSRPLVDEETAAPATLHEAIGEAPAAHARPPAETPEAVTQGEELAPAAAPQTDPVRRFPWEEPVVLQGVSRSKSSGSHRVASPRPTATLDATLAVKEPSPAPAVRFGPAILDATATEKDAKPLGWIRRLLRLEDEPAAATAGQSEGTQESRKMQAAPVAMPQIIPSAPVPVASSAKEQIASPATAAPATPPVPPSTDAEAEDVLPVATPAESPVLETAEPLPVEPLAVDTDQPEEMTEPPVSKLEHSTAPAPVSVIELPVATVSQPNGRPSSSRNPLRTDLKIEGVVSILTTARPVFETPFSFTQPASQSVPATTPLTDVPRPTPAPAAQQEDPAELRNEPKAKTAQEPERPKVSFPRYPAASPITIAASFPDRRPREPSEPRTDPESTDEGAPTKKAVQPVTPSGARRAGLAKAMMRAGSEEGPPARASEGLTAMRRGSGLLKAVSRQEAALRPQPQTETAVEQPGLTRRWGMLSRFERADLASTGTDGKAPDRAEAGAKNGPGDSSRKSHV